MSVKAFVITTLLVTTQICWALDLPISLDVKNSSGETGDKELNRLFNRDITPKESFWLNPSDFSKLPSDLQQSRQRERWWEDDKLKAYKWESAGIQTKGYIGRSQHLEDPAWRHTPQVRTFLMDLTENPGGAPFIQGILNDSILKRRGITFGHLSELRKNNTLLTFTGWLVWDNAYYKQWFFIITKIEYMQYGVPKEI